MILVRVIIKGKQIIKKMHNSEEIRSMIILCSEQLPGK